MFSFHKPKIYRSNAGCCICKAKSSSSRFTDSKKYEAEFERCFRIQETRSGEICNACVLLVKRWKKLSPENRCTKHWHHVVDARAGPAKLANVARGRYSGGHHRLFASKAQQQQSVLTVAPQATTTTGSSSLSTTSPLSSYIDQKQSDEDLSSQKTSEPKPQAAKANSLPAQPSTSSSGGQQGSKPLASIQTLITTRRSVHPSQHLQSSLHRPPARTTFATTPTKPNSALSSTAFEEVILRYRQRQQQELKHARKRQQTRQQRCSPAATTTTGNHQQQLPATSEKLISSLETPVAAEQESSPVTGDLLCAKKRAQQYAEQSQSQVSAKHQPAKRAKRCSDSLGSICVDGFRVSSILDVALWRKEKVCCGIIFRGRHNEIAIFPKLFRPRQCAFHRQNLVNSKRKELNEMVSTAKVSEEIRSDDIDEDSAASIRATARTSTNTTVKQLLPSADVDDTTVQSVSNDTVAPETVVSQVLPETGVTEDDDSNDLRQPRIVKSGSLSSSSDSSTSGTGSMEQFDSLELNYWNH